ncbi:MAG: hypothetical protein NZR01_12075, partial [Bryobacteraceae bacterium]|nr:hypothetical protein [Bryobacteraceae bacterium]
GMRAGFRIRSIRVLSSGCSGSMAWTVGTYEAENAGARVSGVHLGVLRHGSRGWRIAAHESAVPDEQAATRPAPDGR